MRVYIALCLLVLILAPCRAAIKAISYGGDIARDRPANSKSAAVERFINFGGSSSNSNSNGNFLSSEFSFSPLNSLLGDSSNADTISIENGNLITLGIVTLIPLIIGLALLFYLIGGAGGNITGFRRSDLDMTARSAIKSFNSINWEQFSILDWIAVAEDTWRNFEPRNIDCQKRLICEVHQNTMNFGFIAKKMVDAFSYLEYTQVMQLPQEIQVLIEDYMDAANNGRKMKKDCGELYAGCDFSVKRIVNRISHNEI